jgi:penicillin-binding protein 1A
MRARLPAVLRILRRKRAPKRRRIRKLRLLALLAILGVLGFASFAMGLLASISTKIPQLDPNRQHTQANTYVYASDGHTVLAILRGSQARIVVPSERISPWMKHAIVAIEDKRFYEHHGVDIRGMARAVWADVTHHGTVQGGSTITQQFVKNAFLTSQKTIGRKLVEAALAWQLEQKWTKDQILTAYLNTVYLDNHAYGVEQASRVYFHHSADTLSIPEAALLAGIVEDPSLYDPVAHPQEAKARRNLVLLALYQQQYLTHQQYATALKAPMPNPHGVYLPGSVGQHGQYFANFVADQLAHSKQFGHLTYGGGLKVRTTLDLNLQRYATQAVQSALPSTTGLDAALVSIDVKTGAIVAMVGGRNFHQSQFNLATQGIRQPGSSFKPFVLAAALEDGIAPSSIFQSKPVTIDAGGRLWKVNNFEGEYLGPIDLTKAIAVSDNAVYSQLTALVGPSAVVQAAHSLGISTPLQPYFSIGLGAQGTTPLDMARAYESFADGGTRVDGSLLGNTPRAITQITDAKGKVLQNEPVHVPALGSAADSRARADLIDEMLQGVVTGGTGTAAALPGRQVAGKTGTTENYGDAWFVGYTPQLVTAVWVGYPEKLIPMTTEFHGGPVEGGTFPALIWKAFMTKALAYGQYGQSGVESFELPSLPYASPRTVVNAGKSLELDNGNCHNAVQVELYSSWAPTRTANCKPNAVDVPDVVGSTLAAAKERLALQPLTPAVVYAPAKKGQRIGVVVGQIPKGGTLSAWDKVTLVLPKRVSGTAG